MTSLHRQKIPRLHQVPQTPVKQTTKIDIVLSHPAAKLPTRVTDNSAGFDLYCVESVNIKPGQTCRMKTGCAIAIPEGHYGKLETKSSFALQQLLVIGGIIDSDYRGEISVILHNLSTVKTTAVFAGMKFAQLIIHPYQKHICFCEQTSLSETERGERGFGSLDE